MRTRLRYIVHLSLRSILTLRDSPARLTVKRFLMLSLFVPAFVALQLVHKVAFALDGVFFRGYRDVEIKKPLFMTGVPRSGTTLLHRLLALDTKRTTTHKLWELVIAPSITERCIVHALGRIDNLLGAPIQFCIHKIEAIALKDLEDVHPTSLESPEEDYLALTPVMACFLLILPFPFYDELWYLSRFDDEATDDEKDRVMQFYRGIIQRHLYWHGADKKYISKNPSFSAMVATLNEYFPDAQFIGSLRNPEKVYPSLLNSMTEGAQMFDNDLQGGAYWIALGDMLDYYYHHVPEVLDALPEDRATFVTMESLVGDSLATVLSLYERFGWHLHEDYEAALNAETKAARKFRSKHKYTLEQFDLTPGQLQERFAPLYQRFDWPRTKPAHAERDGERIAS